MVANCITHDRVVEEMEGTCCQRVNGMGDQCAFFHGIGQPSKMQLAIVCA